ncbi:CHASE2 domain-containing protein, partial [Nostoc sp. ChiSLP03a]|uniref:CHASE2 domain-containing protein n=1 Tax=Nostoc sp. ChiSLP03a TaxID=3075380 RepID=UPI002AD54DBC
REKWPLSDRTINQLLKKIESYQPRIVGLYLFRPEDNNLAANFQNQDNIVTTCLFSSLGRDEIPPPPNVPIDNVGFSDVVADNEIDQSLRRTLLFANSTDKKCTTSFAFGALIAINYLQKQGIAYDFTQKGDFILGKTLFMRLQPNSGGYQHLDAKGYQILLNYRHPNSLADQVNLTDVLSDQVNPSLFKDRLVIIGPTAANIPSPSSGFYTPYSALPDQPARMPALFIHAQIASQLISTVLDGRPLINFWTEAIEEIWILGWSLVGASISLLFWRWASWKWSAFSIFFAMIGLAGICYLAFLEGWWLPLIPAMVTLLSSMIPMPVVPSYPLDKLRFQRSLELILEAYNENLADARIAVEYLINSNPSKRTTTEGLVSVVIDTLNSCQTLETIAALANQLAWIPSQLPKALSSVLPLFLQISQGVKNALDVTQVVRQRELLNESINALRSLSASLASEIFSREASTFKSIAERWLAILNDRARG